MVGNNLNRKQEVQSLVDSVAQATPPSALFWILQSCYQFYRYAGTWL